MPDWTKPIRREDGRPCECQPIPPPLQNMLTRTGKVVTHHVHVLGIDESTFAGAAAAHRYVADDGFDGIHRFIN